jgi:hypothetical protein
MHRVAAVLVSALLASCGGPPKGGAAAATLEPATVTDCAGACDRVARCWQAQYGQADAEGDRAECLTRCAAKPETDQASAAAAVGAETSCPTLLDLE